MGCISNASFGILINGEASEFFHACKGLRQGCPLSPLLFLLNMEVLTKLLEKAKAEGTIKGVKLSEFIQLTHLLFVDDVLIFHDGTSQDTISFRKILEVFCKATGMDPNHSKPTIILVKCIDQGCRHALAHFHFGRRKLEDGIKYLGFCLKPNDYRITDWNWLIAKVERRVEIWQ